MDLGIAGRRALVSASSSGLGLSAAKALGEAGCSVVMSARDQDRLREAAEGVAGSVRSSATCPHRLERRAWWPMPPQPLVAWTSW